MKLSRIKSIDLFVGTALLMVLKPIVVVIGWCTHRDHEPEVRDEVLFIKLLGGGSLLIALPGLLGFRKNFPGTRMRLLTTKGVRPFAETMGVFDDIHTVDTSSLLTVLRSGLRTWRANFRVDTVFNLEVYSRLSTVMSLMSAARNRAGFYLENAEWRFGLNTHLTYFNRYAGSYYFYEKMLEAFGGESATMDACRQRVLERLPGYPVDEPIDLVLGFTCSENGRERMLTPEQWVQVFRERDPGAAHKHVWLLGGPWDRSDAEQYIAVLAAALPDHVFHNHCGQTKLPESLAILAAAKTFWGIDSGLMHYARLFQIPSVSWWGPTDPATRLKPIPGLGEERIYEAAPCSPCIHVTEYPPCGGDNICIQNLFLEPEKQRDWIGVPQKTRRRPMTKR